MKLSTIITNLSSTGMPHKTILKFLKWHSKNLTVWLMFQDKTLALIKAGKKHWGAKAIMEVIRYERAEKEGGGFTDYSVNNNYPAYYARMFAIKYPQYKNFFEFREIKGLKEAA